MGSFSILNNISGLSAQNQLNMNNVNLARTLNRLSSGKRINTGADDAAGLQIADSLRANVGALNQAVRNANDGVSVGQIADGARPLVRLKFEPICGKGLEDPNRGLELPLPDS
jgi:flagellin